jgi:hypothetical protein
MWFIEEAGSGWKRLEILRVIWVGVSELVWLFVYGPRDTVPLLMFLLTDMYTEMK